MATIAENLEALQNTLTNIKTALTSKGVTPSDALVDVPDEIDSIQTGTQPVLQSITINNNGTYAPGVGVDGYNEVIVNVQPVQSNVTVKALFPDNNVPGRAWRSGLMKLEYSTDGETWTSVTRTGTSGKYNTYVVPNDCLVRPDVNEPQNQVGQQNFYNDNGGDSYTTGTYSAIYSLHTPYSYTIYGESAVSTALEQMIKVTQDNQIVIFCYSQTNN